MIDQLLEAIRPHRDRLIGHPIYRAIDSPAALRYFMEHHVFAVWDFMTLLKALQIRLTCVAVPWTPTPDREARRLVNEIVLAEESDEDGAGGYASHFESYLEAMAGTGADVGPIHRFVDALTRGTAVLPALEAAGAPGAARDFVAATWGFVESDSLPTIAAAFTLGREDLIADLFRGLVARVAEQDPEHYRPYLRYLDRHVHLDGDEHGPMALNLLATICGTDEARWATARAAAIRALEARQALWDGVVAAIEGSAAAR